jgi:hypothetical protein
MSRDRLLDRSAPIALLLAILASAAQAADWDQWRGPGRDGNGEQFGTLDAWPKEPEIRWSVAAGTGQASPLVIGDLVVLFDRTGDSERVQALRLDNGETIWTHSEPVRFKAAMGGRRYGAGPKATPLVAKGLVVTYGVTAILTARRLEDGGIVWRRDLNEDARDPTLRWGNSMSPIAAEDQVIVQFGNDRNGGVRSFDLATGEECWNLDGFGSSYGSPILVGEGSSRHIALMTYAGPLGLSLSGELLWSRELPMSLARQNVSTPSYLNDVLVYTAIERPLTGERLSREAGAWSLETVWKREDLPHELASPIAFDDRVCGFTKRNKGQLFCVDLETGEDLWRGPPRDGEFAVLFTTPQHLLVVHDDGRLVVLPRSATSYEPVAEYEISTSETWSHPAVVRGGLVVKDLDRLRHLRFDTKRD